MPRTKSQANKMTEKTSNGIPYTWDISSSTGADFILFPEPHHTDADVLNAKIEIRAERDVVSLRIANEDDRDDLYRSEIFRHPEVRKLKWYQIDADNYKFIRKCRRADMSIDDYVKNHALPFVEKTEAENLRVSGTSIYDL